MKNSLKKISFVLAAVTLMSASAATVSAGGIFKNEGGSISCPVVEEPVALIPVSPKKPVIVKTTTEYVPASDKADPYNPATIFVTKETQTEIKAPVFTSSCGLAGAKYYTRDDAKKALEEYFSANTCDIYMNVGQEKTFCDGAYFYSSDPDVVYYNYKTGTLVAENTGSAEVFVYTSGGVPIFKANVYVSRRLGATKVAPTLSITPDDWRPEIGDKIGFTVTASDGKTYDDIEIKITKGKDKATLTQVSHKLTAEKNGAVVVYAYSKSNPSICGEALVYIGPYEYSICDGYWNYGKDCINVTKWYDWCGDYYYYINGWIKSAEGIFIPVIKFSEAKVTDGEETKTSTVVTIGGASYADLIRAAYGDKCQLASVISEYNLYKYGIFKPVTTTVKYPTFCGTVDPRVFYMSQLFGYYAD